MFKKGDVLKLSAAFVLFVTGHVFFSDLVRIIFWKFTCVDSPTSIHLWNGTYLIQVDVGNNLDLPVTVYSNPVTVVLQIEKSSLKLTDQRKIWRKWNKIKIMKLTY